MSRDPAGRNAGARRSRTLRAGRHVIAALFSLCLAAQSAGAADRLRIGGTGSALGTMRSLLEAFRQHEPDVTGEVPPSLGSSGGIRAVLAGAIDIAVSARPLKQDEIMAGAVSQIYGRTAVVLATGEATPVAGLTRKEVVEIYAGTRQHWPDGTRIRIVLRPDAETDTHLLQDNIPGLDKAWTAAKRRPGIPISYTDQQTADLLESLPGSLGPIALSLILSENRALKPLALDGVVPTRETVADGSYGLTKTYRFVTAPDPAPATRKFLAFAGSPEGQEILRATGHAAVQAEGIH